MFTIYSDNWTEVVPIRHRIVGITPVRWVVYLVEVLFMLLVRSEVEGGKVVVLVVLHAATLTQTKIQYIITHNVTKCGRHEQRHPPHHHNIN